MFKFRDLLFTFAILTSLAGFAAPDDGPNDSAGYSVLNDLNNCLRSKAQEVKAPKAFQDSIELFFDKLKIDPSPLLEEYKKSFKFKTEMFESYLPRMSTRSPSSTRETEANLKRVGSKYDSQILLDSPTGAPPAKPLAYDKDLLRKMLSDCIEETDFSEVRKKMSSCGKDGIDEITGPDAKKLDKLQSKFLSGGESLRQLKDKATVDAMGAKCDRFGQIGGFIICSNNGKLDYYRENSPETALMKDCDRLAYDKGSLTCLTELRGANNELKYKMARRHMADGKADPTCKGLYGPLPTGKPGKGGNRTETPSR